ncbi:MAG TPA: protein kinase [Gemmataceae bacterium]|nr:protein kinase [Gemmataceae bacterium]
MAAHPVLHPSNDALRAFALGKLNDLSTAALMNHLDSCPDCCRIVAAIPGDDFLARLRQARGQNSSSTPAKALSETDGGMKPAPSQHVIANLPSELANNQQYQILRELGRGGMGVVYLAKNKLMDRLEVLKVVNKTLLDHPGAVERFLREIRSAAKLSHANVVAAYSALQMGELLAFAMEYIEGQDLASLVKAQGPLPIPHACFYVQQAAHGLQHAFDKGMVHRDIKPQNLILAREGKKHIVKVLDFGLAKVMREKSEDTGLTGEGKMLGTPDYIAPEQTLDAARADIRADIYSLGCTLYFLLSGHPPFSASSLGAILVAHQMHEAKPLNLVRPEVLEELAAVVRKMMAKLPAKRYQTPLEVVQALAPFVKQGATPKPAPELSVGLPEAKPVVKKAVRVDPPPPIPAAEAPKKPPGPVNVWGALTEDDGASAGSRKSRVSRKPRTATASERNPQRKWLIGAGVGVGLLLLSLLVMWTSGVFKEKTANGIPSVEAPAKKGGDREPPAVPEPVENDPALWKQANELNSAAWKVVQARGAAKAEYVRALREAEAAAHLAPRDGNFLNTLGVAQYRAGRYADALATLTKSAKLNAAKANTLPTDLAFLAMAQHKLGKKDEAKTTLDRLRQVMKQPNWEQSGEAVGFLREAEELIEGKTAGKGQ